MSTKIQFYKGDLPSSTMFQKSVAIDTEAMGLLHTRDRLCMVQLSSGEGDTHLVQIEKGQNTAPHLESLLKDDKIQKIFHFARFDIALLMKTFSLTLQNVYCTKIASKLVRTYTNQHGLKDLCAELLGITLSKEQQTTDWGALTITDEQKQYAANDVLHLHKIKEKLDVMLAREGREKLAQFCFDFLKTRAELDLLAGTEFDIFSHKG